MAYTISASGFATKKFLKVHENYLEVYETVGFGSGKKQVLYTQVDYVLLEPANNTLSLQMGTDVFSVPYRQDKQEHQAAVQMLLAGLQKYGNAFVTGGFPVAAPPPPPPPQGHYPPAPPYRR